MELDDLVDTLGAEVRGFESERQWGQALLEFVEFVYEHDFCDDRGQPDEIQFILSEWMDTDDFLGDAFEIPHVKYEQDALAWAIQQSDPVAEADAAVDRAQQGRDPNV